MVSVRIILGDVPGDWLRMEKSMYEGHEVGITPEYTRMVNGDMPR